MAFDNELFRGGAAKSVNRLRLTATDNQLEFGNGGVLSWNPTVARTITFPDAGGEVVTTEVLSDVPLATATTVGTVKVPTAGRLAVDGAGAVSVDTTKVPALDLNNTFTTAGSTASSGAASLFSITPTVAQSGTAGYTAFKVNVTSTSTGSGNQNLLDLQVGSSSKFAVTASGDVFPTGLLTLAKALTTKAVTPTFSATVSLDPTAGNVFILNGVSTTSATSTLNLATVPAAGTVMWVILNASGSGTVTYTFGTNFRSTGTGAPTANKTLVVAFVSDGTNAVEISRTSALLA